MDELAPSDPDFAARVRANFARQKVMATLGAQLELVEPGQVQIHLPAHEDWTQQHGYLHAGIATTIADSAGGYAAFTLMPAGSEILAVELKVNLLAPGRGDRFRATGRVVKTGRRLSVSEIEVEAHHEGTWTRTLFGLQTTICLPQTES